MQHAWLSARHELDPMRYRKATRSGCRKIPFWWPFLETAWSLLLFPVAMLFSLFTERKETGPCQFLRLSVEAHHALRSVTVGIVNFAI